MSEITTTDWIVAGAAIVQIAVSGLLLWYIRNQKGIMEDQKAIFGLQFYLTGRRDPLLFGEHAEGRKVEERLKTSFNKMLNRL